MAASDTYYLKTAVFTPSGGSAKTIDGLEEITFRQGGQVVAHGTDGSITIMAHFLDNVEGQVTCRSRNAGLAVAAELQPGVVGSLVLTMQKRKGGTGPVSAADKVITAATSMIGQTNGTLPHVDRSTFEVEFHCADASGSAVFAFS